MQRSGASIMAWNVFRFCTVLRGLGSLMILFVLATVGLTYYAVVVPNCGPAILTGGLDSVAAAAVLILFHGLLAMLLWCYFSVVTDPGSVPPNWRPATVDEESGEAIALTSSDFSSPIQSLQQPSSLADSGNPRIRYCKKCNQLKPPRCHHCSVFLHISLRQPLLLSLLFNFIPFFKDGEIPDTPGTLAFVAHLVFNMAFALSVLGVLIMHVTLVLGNTTTIEAYEKKTTPKWRYDLGRKKNFEQVFGTDKKYWFIPSYSKEDLRNMPVLQGHDYPSKPDLDERSFDIQL